MPGPWEKFQGPDTTSGEGPWAKFQTERAVTPPKYTEGESAILGATQGAVLGFADELGGVGKTAYDTVFGPAKLKDAFDNYRANRDSLRNEFDTAQRENPKSYLGGNVAGSIGTALIPGVGAAASTLKGAVALGAASGLGQSQADLTKAEIPQAVNDTLTGGVVGGVTAGALNTAGNVGNYLVNKFSPTGLRNMAYDRAVKSATGGSIGQIRKLAGANPRSMPDLDTAQESLRTVGKDLMNSGAIKPGYSTEDIAPLLSAKKDQIGQRIGDVASTVDQVAPNAVDNKKIVQDMLDYAATIPETGGGQNLQNRILQEAELIQKGGPLNFKDAQAIKNQYAYKHGDADALISNQDVTNKLRSIVSNNMEDAAANAANMSSESKPILDQYLNLKNQYKSFKGASQAASDEALKGLSRRVISPSDYATGGVLALGQMAHGGVSPTTVLTGAVAAGVHKLIRERGSSLAANGLMKAAQLMEASPEFMQQFGPALANAAKEGPMKLALTHALLMKNPKYSETIQEGNLP